jgi:hypothetical protein
MSIVRRHEASRDPIFKDVAQPAVIGSNDRNSDRHRFYRDSAKRLRFARRNHDDVRCGHNGIRVGDEVSNSDSRRVLRSGNANLELLFHVWLIRRRATQEQELKLNVRWERVDGFEQKILTLPSIDATHHQDERPAIANAER